MDLATRRKSKKEDHELKKNVEKKLELLGETPRSCRMEHS
jgi:hypothetical protein